MSFNVSHVECISGELTILEEGVEWIDRNWRSADDGPDAWFPECGPELADDNTVKVYWSGEGSGNAVLCGALEKFFSFTRGTAEFIFYWEGGVDGYRVIDGKMTRHEIDMSLGKEVK
jgi:hypothetical protein